MKILFKSALFFVLLHSICSAQVGIGTSSPVDKLTVYDGNVSMQNPNTAEVGIVLSASGILKFYGAKNNTSFWAGIGSQRNGYSDDLDLRFYTIYQALTPVERMRITSLGELLINTTSDAGDYKLQVNGTAYGTAWNTPSDMRLKNIYESISSVDNINVIKYEWKDGRDDRVHIGYGAQEVERILPDAVLTGNDGLKSVNYDEVHTYKLMRQELLIKELQQQIEELQKIVKRKRRIK